MPETLHLDAALPSDITRAAEILRAGGTVAFPTETVYGLGANALSAKAVAKIFEAKQRPSWDPVIVHIADASQLGEIVTAESAAEEVVEKLSAAFWPGPLTLLLPRRGAIPDTVTAGRPLVAVRVPAHPVALALLRAAGVPVAAPSANVFGHTSPTTAAHVLADLDGRVDAVLDGGATPVGLESTVLDSTQTPMVLYRPGAVTAEAITAATGVEVEVYRSAAQRENETPGSLPAPGVGIRHYAPRAHVLLVDGEEKALRAAVEQTLADSDAVGVLLPDGWNVDGAALIETWGPWADAATLAAEMFAALRSLDDRGAEVVLCPLPQPGGMNDAIRDRLMKAARPK